MADAPRASSSQSRCGKTVPAHPDALRSTRGQALLRLLASVGLAVYLVAAHDASTPGDASPDALWLAATFLAFSALAAAAVPHARIGSLARGAATGIADIAAVTCLLVATGTAGAPLFVCYLWVILRNGFRSGVPALCAGAALSIIGFAVLLYFSETWREQGVFSFAVATALVVVPVYVAHLICQLNKSSQLAAEVVAGGSRFLVRLSQELRSPLDGIVAATETLLAGRRLTREDRALLGALRSSAVISLRRIDNVLNPPKIAAYEHLTRQADFDLHKVVNEAARIARAKGLRVLARIAPTAPFRLVGDPDYLGDILLNLVFNAAQFTEGDRVTIDIDGVPGGDRRALLRFEIRSTAAASPRELSSRFLPGIAPKDNHSTRRHGTTFAGRLIEWLDGRFGVAGSDGGDRVVWFELPFGLQPGRNDTDDILAGACVLLVSGDLTLRAALEAMLARWQSRLIVSDSGADAVNALARSMRGGKPIHTLLADKSLALGEDGTHGLRELCDKAMLADTPVILLGDETPSAEWLREQGYAAFLGRPPAAPLLFAALRASPHCGSGTESGIVRVEPWAWSRRLGTSRRVLIADDNRTNLMIVRKILESAHYQVDTAQDGEEALHRLVSGGYKAAIVDMHMPGLDGVELLRQYRALRPGSSLPLIVLTVNVTAEATRECAAAGANAFLTKPVSTDALLTTVERLVEETEVCEHPVLAQSSRPADGERSNTASEILDRTVLSELDRLQKDPAAVASVIDTFEADGRALLEKLFEAGTCQDHNAFREGMHALKGNAANVGAVRLGEACEIAQNAGFLEFSRQGGTLLDDVEARFEETLHALRQNGPPAGTAGDHYSADGR